jgi:MFS family permease
VTDAPLLTRPFVLAFASHFVLNLAFNLYLHLPGFLKLLGASELEIGVIFGLTALTAVAVRPILGRVMDRRGRKIVIVAGGALHTVVCVLYLTVTHVGPWVYAVRIAHGVGEATLFASLFAFAADVVPASRRIQGIAIFGVSGMLPIGLSGALGDAILARGGYTHLFWTSIAFSATGLALSGALVETRRTSDEPPRGFMAAVLERDLMPLWWTGLCFATAIAAYFTFLKTFVMQTGIGSVGAFFTAYSLSAIFLRLTAGGLPDRLGPKRVLLPALATLACGLFVLARAASGAVVVGAGVLCGLGHGYAFPILLGMVVDRARASERGAALAIFTALFDAGTLIGGPLLGYVIRAVDYAHMFATAGGLVLAGALGCVIFDRRP